jgi:thiosulfate dehydrogenase [quinone] large subunit
MSDTKLDRGIIFLLCVFVGWMFVYSGSWQILQNYSAGGFLTHVVTFHGLFAPFATPGLLPYTDFLMKWGHLLIGLSLVSGLMVRISGPFGILLMITYHFAHMQWPFIGIISASSSITTSSTRS